MGSDRLVWFWLFSAVLSVVQCRSMSDDTKYTLIADEESIDEFVRPTNHAKIARDLVHQSDWASFGTVSTIKNTLGYPMVSITSVADSPRGGNSTGNIYFFVAKESLKYKDLVKLNEATLLFSDAQTTNCQKQSIDPIEPTCSRVMISGLVYRLVNGTKDFDTGRSAFVSRHPAANDWLEKHDMVLCQLEIKQILVKDFYGDTNNVSVKDYFNYKSDDSITMSLEQLQPDQDQTLHETFPFPTNHAKVARDLVHAANWTSMGTISTIKNIRGYPMVSVSSVADSRFGFSSTGNVYFFLAKESLEYKDLIVKNQASMLFSEAHTMACQSRGTDPMEPTCMRAMISGLVAQLKNGTDEFEFARTAFVDRHPVAVTWLEAHGMLLCQLKIEQILVIDYYGGSKHVSVEDYYKVKDDKLDSDSIEMQNQHQLLPEEVRVHGDSDHRVHIQIHKKNNESVIDIYV